MCIRDSVLSFDSTVCLSVMISDMYHNFWKAQLVFIKLRTHVNTFTLDRYCFWGLSPQKLGVGGKMWDSTFEKISKIQVWYQITGNFNQTLASFLKISIFWESEAGHKFDKITNSIWYLLKENLTTIWIYCRFRNFKIVDYRVKNRLQIWNVV